MAVCRLWWCECMCVDVFILFLPFHCFRLPASARQPAKVDVVVPLFLLFVWFAFKCVFCANCELDSFFFFFSRFSRWLFRCLFFAIVSGNEKREWFSVFSSRNRIGSQTKVSAAQSIMHIFHFLSLLALLALSLSRSHSYSAPLILCFLLLRRLRNA